LAYLKSLELTGFKSFPDKVNISFTDGVCAIVGPNGSGKSNICDAIRWVFGEQSAKTLRGDKMEDVIFGGTQTRKPVGFAEVTLTLDNASGMLKSDYSEISVTRRYYRSGESEYFINRAPMRLKDIHELFMDTGLGRDGYSIIGQGRIAEILSQKSADRRQIFEEAAGISKYRYKKTESERKLKSTEENIVRLSDIISTLDERIGTLESQSKKAKEYLSLRDRLRELEVTLWLNTTDKIRENEKSLGEKISLVKDELEAKTRESADADARLETIYTRQNEADIEINTKRSELHDMKLDIQKRENDAVLKKSTLERNESDITRLKLQRDLRREKSADNETLINELREYTKKLEADFDVKKSELDELLNEGSDVSSQAADKLYEIEILRREIEQKTAYLSLIREKISAIDTKLELRLSQSGDARKSIDEQLDISKALSEKIASLSEAADGTKEELEALEKEHSQKSEALSLMEDEISKMQNEYAVMQKADAAAGARLSMLLELQNELEGYSGSVKFVIRQSKDGHIRGIEGAVADLFTVDEKYTTAIEITLGGAIQNIVTRNENDAKEAIQRLKNANRGRATFLPMTSIKGSYANFGALSSCTGFIACAADVVRHDEKYSGIFTYLLGRTALFDNLDNAVAAAKKTGYKTRIVTLDGQTINAGGAMTGGSFNKSSGILTRSGEILKLKEECALREREMEDLRTRGSDKKSEILKLREDVQSVLKKRALIEKELTNKKSELEYLIKSEADAKERASALERQSDDSARQMELDRKEKTTLDENALNVKSSVDEARAKLILLQNEYDTKNVDAKQFEKRIAEARLSLELIKKDIDTNASQIEAYERQSSEFLNEDAAISEDIIRLEKENSELQNGIAEAEKSIEELKAQAKVFHENLEKMISDKMELDREANTLSKSSRELSQRAAELERELIRLETKLESSLSELEQIATKMWDSYELTPTTAVKYKLSDEEMSQTKMQQLTSELKRKINALGNINLDSIEEYAQTKEKLDFLKSQTDDLVRAKESLESIITGLTRRMKEIFTEQFDLINKNFSQTFTELFGGGRAWMELEDKSDVLNCGIEIHVQPPGKNVKSITLLSGGEQAFTAIAVLFAMLKIRPTPFCVFDEVEAALDEVNVARFGRYISDFKDKTQFVVITHRRGTMEFADMLYGVTMQEKGVSKLLSINVRDVAKQMNILQ